MKEDTDKCTEATSGDPDFDLWGVLFQTRDVIYKARGKELTRYGITVMDSAVLVCIDYLGDKATPAKVSRLLFREHHTIAGQLTRMENKGLITETKGIIQKNIITLGLTDKGRKALKQSISRQSLHNIFSSLTTDERKQLWSILMKLRKAAIKEMGGEDTYYYPTPPS